jgi:hypothetical protein
VWIDAMHWEAGGGRASGAFHLRPVRRADVGPAEFETKGASLFVGRDRVLDHVEGRIEVTIGAFDPRTVHGTDVFNLVSSRLEASGDIVSDPGLAPEGITTRLEGGRAQMKLLVTDGRLDDGSAAHVELERAHLRSGAFRASAQLEAEADVRDNVARWSVRASSVALDDDRAPNAVARAKRLDVTGSTRELSLARGAFEPGSYVVDLPSAAIADARVLATWQKGLGIDAGSGTFGGRLRVDGSRVEGEAKVGLTGARLHTADLAFGGALEATLVVAGRLDRELDFSRSRLELRDVSLPHPRKGPEVPPGWWADVEVRGARLEGLEASPSVEGTILVRCKNARPLLDALVSESGLPSWVPRVFTMEGLRAEASGRLAKGTVDLTGLRATGSAFTINASYLDHDRESRGVVLVTDGPLSAGLETKDGKTHLADHDALDWLSQRLRQRWPERTRRRARPSQSPLANPRPRRRGTPRR